MKLELMKNKEMFDMTHTIAGELFEKHEYPWEVLGDLKEFIEEAGAGLPQNEYKKIGPNIWIHRTAQMAPTIAMAGPMIIGPKAQVRQGAFLRGSVIIGEHAVVGNSCEIKNSILFDEVQVPHFNYVGDSVLGYKAHMGAGAVTSNVKADKGIVSIHSEDGDVKTGRKKVGAMLGDGAEIGCNSVLNPGTVVGRNSNVYPLSNVRGCVPAGSIYKAQGVIVEKDDREVEMEASSEAHEKGKGGLKVVK